MPTEEFVLLELSRSDKQRLKTRAAARGEDWLTEWEFLSRLVYTAMRLERGETVGPSYKRFVRFFEHGRASQWLTYRESAVLAYYNWLGLDLGLTEVRGRISEFPLFLVGDSGTRYEF